MPRNKVIVKFPTLNDKGGDLSKKWYVEYFYRVPGEDAPRKRRISEGLCSGSAEERYRNADKLIRKLTAWLKSPDLLSCRPDDVSRVLADDTVLRPEADRYAAYMDAMTVERLTASFLDYLQGSIAQKTYETYKSKLKYYAAWLKEKELLCCSVSQQDVIPFFQWLAKERNLTKRSVFKYRQILHSFYAWLIRQGHCTDNPIEDIPAYGRIVDMAPAPMQESDIVRLKRVIAREDPMLWLACCIQYYCAIRPGTELRLLRVGDIGKDSFTIRQENAKNRHKETVPMPDELVRMIDELGIRKYPADFYVFGRYNIPAREPVGKNTLRNRFNQFRDDLGVSRSVKFYSWKHTGAISLVEAGVSVWELQHHMRHSSVTTTEEYIRQRASQSRQALELIKRI